MATPTSDPPTEPALALAHEHSAAPLSLAVALSRPTRSASAVSAAKRRKSTHALATSAGASAVAATSTTASTSTSTSTSTSINPAALHLDQLPVEILAQVFFETARLAYSTALDVEAQHAQIRSWHTRAFYEPVAALAGTCRLFRHIWIVHGERMLPRLFPTEARLNTEFYARYVAAGRTKIVAGRSEHCAMVRPAYKLSARASPACECGRCCIRVVYPRARESCVRGDHGDDDSSARPSLLQYCLQYRFGELRKRLQIMQASLSADGIRPGTMQWTFLELENLGYRLRS